MVHTEDFEYTPKETNSGSGAVTTAFATKHHRGKICLPIVPVKVMTLSGKYIYTYALLDNGSNTTFCTDSLLQKLNVTGNKTKYRLSTVDGESNQRHGRIVNLQATDVEEKCFVELKNVLSTDFLPLSSRDIPEQKDLSSWPHLCDIALVSLPVSVSGATVEQLIGNDNHELLQPLEIRKSVNKGPYAVKTVFGWVVNGPVSVEKQQRHLSFLVMADELLNQ